MIRRDLLPREQKAYEVAARDRFDLLSQSIQCVTVNSSEQTTRAPLGRSRSGSKFTADYKTLSLEFQQSRFDFQFV